MLKQGVYNKQLVVRARVFLDPFYFVAKITTDTAAGMYDDWYWLWSGGGTIFYVFLAFLMTNSLLKNLIPASKQFL